MLSKKSKHQAAQALKEASRADREARLLQVHLDQIHQREENITELALDWQANKWRKICWFLYWLIMLPLSVASIGIIFLVHLAIKNTWGKPVYWFLFVILSVATWGIYIPIHFLYKIGVAER